MALVITLAAIKRVALRAFRLHCLSGTIVAQTIANTMTLEALEIVRTRVAFVVGLSLHYLTVLAAVVVSVAALGIILELAELATARVVVLAGAKARVAVFAWVNVPVATVALTLLFETLSFGLQHLTY